MLSPTLIRRYTPPTCSLEIVAKTSALSQWTGNPVIKELRFELSLDDPRLTNEQKILLTGDRQQLEDLVEAVTDYVQNFLQQTNPVFDFAPTQNIFTYQTQSTSNVATIARPQLETKGLLSHRLHLGRLANDISGQTIQLSATQLFDLANALESYSADMVALPAFTASRNRQNIIRWGAIAASFFIVIGVSRTALQLQNSQKAEQAIANSAAPATEKHTEKLVPPDPHASYTFVPIPAKEDPQLLASKTAPKIVNLNAKPPASPKPSAQAAPAPAKNTSSAPVVVASKAFPPPSPSTAGDSLVKDAEAFAIASSPAGIAQRSAVEPTQNGAFRDRRQQAEQYFQDQWHRPTDLNETLQYRLTLDPAGTIQKVFPVGKAAELYQNQLTFLAIGNTITSRSKTDLLPLRLVLDPDGTVQVFTEPPPIIPADKSSTMTQSPRGTK